jgi:ribosomal RNA assembly protein
MIDEVKIVKKKIVSLKEEKEHIESSMGTKIEVNNDGIVKIEGDDGLAIWLTKKMVVAFAMGFDIKSCLKINNEEYSFELLDVRDFGRDTKKDIMRLKGRVIGTDGRCKKNIEIRTETHISVSGKRIGIIGKIEDVELCKKTLEMILNGAKHSTAFKSLEKAILKRKKAEFAPENQENIYK